MLPFHGLPGLFLQLLPSFLLAAGLALLFQMFYNRYYHPLSLVPGPFWASMTRIWWLLIAGGGKQHEVHMAMHKKYGPIVRVAPDFISIDDPACVQQFYKWDRADGWRVFEARLDIHMVTTARQMKQHNFQKKRIAAGYTMSAALQSESYLDARVTEWISQLQAHSSNNQLLEFAKWAQWLAMDVVMDMSFGSPLGFVREATDVGGLIHSLRDLFLASVVIFNLPGMIKVMQWPLLFRFWGPKETDKTGMGVIMGTANRAVKKRVQNGNEENRRDILQALIDYVDQDGTKLSREELETEMIAPVAAGTDTTSVALRSIVLFVATNPSVYNKLMAEITLAEEQGRLSHPVQYTEAQTLPYFQAIIKEAMRVYPPVSVPLPRVIPPSSAEVLGFLLPGGTTIHLPQWAQLRRKDVYGEDADLFRPERWLEDEEKTKYWEKIDSSFGAGYCQCLGKNIAMMEINKAMIELFRTFDVMVANPERPWTVKNTMVLVHDEFMVKLTPRIGVK